MSDRDEEIVVIPQSYPLWVAWPTGDPAASPEEFLTLTDESMSAAVRTVYNPQLVVAWECSPGYVPEPVTTEGAIRELGMIYGFTKEEVFDQALDVCRQACAALRSALDPVQRRDDHGHDPAQ